jgi:integrase
MALVSPRERKGEQFVDSGVWYTEPTASRPYWRIDWIDPSTRRRREVVGGKTEKEAMKRASEIAEKLSGGLPVESQRERTTLEEAMGMWLNEPAYHPRWGRPYEEHMADRYKKHVRPLLGNRACGTLTSEDVVRVLTAMQNRGLDPETKKPLPPLAPGTIAKVGLLIGQWNRWARQRGFTNQHLMDGVDIQSITNPAADPSTRHRDEPDVKDSDAAEVTSDMVPDPASIQAFVTALEKSKCPWFGLAAELSATVGIRFGELLSLKSEDVDLKNQTITIARSLERPASGRARFKPTKNRRLRTVPLVPALVPKMEARLAEVDVTFDKLTQSFERRLAKDPAFAAEFAEGEVDPPERLLFPSEEGKRGHRSNINQRIFIPARKEAEAAGWRPYWTFHSLRHSAATHLIALGVDPVAVSAILGHQSGPGFTMRRYVGTQTDHVSRVASALASWSPKATKPKRKTA